MNFTLKTSALMICILLSITVMADDGEECSRLVQDGEHLVAVPFCTRAAEQGHKESQFMLGTLYFNGDGIQQDYLQAQQWFLRAVNQGDPLSLEWLGALYSWPETGLKDDKEAYIWYTIAVMTGNNNSIESQAVVAQSLTQNEIHAAEMEAKQRIADFAHPIDTIITGDTTECLVPISENRFADAVAPCTQLAEQGDVFAQTNLAELYENGLGVEQNGQEAAKWYRAAADQGDQFARLRLAHLYWVGTGVAQSFEQAATLLREGAELGDMAAIHNLGVLHTVAEGELRDYYEAYILLTMSIEAGQSYAADTRDGIVEHLSTNEIRTATDEAERRLAQIRIVN